MSTARWRMILVLVAATAVTSVRGDFRVRLVAGDGNVLIESLEAAEALLSGQGLAGESTFCTPVVNFFEGGTDQANFPGKRIFPTEATSNFVLQISATLVIPQEGDYTLGVNSDDGQRLTLDGAVLIESEEAADTYGSRFLTAGEHELELLFFELDGGATLELFATEGVTSLFGPGLSLIGDIENGGLATTVIDAQDPGCGGSSPQTTARERSALIALYEAAGGGDWRDRSGWKDQDHAADGFNLDPCQDPTWFGVTCEAGGVVEVSLDRNHLVGTVPVELEGLANLRRLWLFGNQLAGPIPPGLANLTRLDDLALSSNRLEGRIPPELGTLQSLRFLNLEANFLTGSIPGEIGNLSALVSLNLQDNQLEGPVPAQLGGLPELLSLQLGRNRLTGSIPPELGNLPVVRLLQLRTNSLTGPIPGELGNLATVQFLALSDNRLSGEVPAELLGLAPNTLDLRYNSLDAAAGDEAEQLDTIQAGEAGWDTLQNVAAAYPQLALGGGFEAIVVLTNGSIYRWRGRGILNGGRWPSERPWELDGEDRTGTTSFNIDLQPGETRRFVLGSSSDTALDGWLSFRADGNSLPGDLAASFFYQLSGPEGLLDSNGIGPAQFGHIFRFPVEQSSSVLTGIAVRAIGEPVFIGLSDAQGVQISFLFLETEDAQLLNELFPDIPGDFLGSVLMGTTSFPYLATVIRVDLTESGVQLTSVPPTQQRN